MAVRRPDARGLHPHPGDDLPARQAGGRHRHLQQPARHRRRAHRVRDAHHDPAVPQLLRGPAGRAVQGRAGGRRRLLAHLRAAGAADEHAHADRRGHHADHRRLERLHPRPDLRRPREPADDRAAQQRHQHDDRRASLQPQHGGHHPDLGRPSSGLPDFRSMVRSRHRRWGSEMSGVNIQGLSIKFGTNEVIKGLDLQVHEGEFLVLLGPSGCGKSTLLHSIAGLIDVSGGSIHIGGQDMTEAEPSERGVGMVFQSYALYPTMTVEKNMSFGPRVAGVPKAEIARRVEKAANMLQLSALLQRKPAQLSGGQRQRVAIGRALVREAGVFLFDEPLSNLDAKLRAELRRELKLLHQTLGNTMIYVTHDQVEAMTLASRIVVMKGGVIQQIGTPAEVYETPANLFVAGFLGAPAINLVPATVGADGVSLDGALPLRLSAGRAKPGQPLVLGVRPEHLRLLSDGRWRATVELVEPMGNHQVVWMKRGEQVLSVIVHDGRRLAAGDELGFDLDEAALNVFDAASEQRL
mmetsp:Transcript_6369/g.11420  ORF Transcript_6369/g.11420 Transcript_6369/m.11420 type:complete len:523 (-) Transcript_6369:229-1797(-)